MGVCRGKVAEGLDFADINGRAVIITGLPYPPLKDPKVILKRRYLDVCNAQNKQYLNGQDWYSLEATRAVNQAMGRVIRHRHDYGAILLLDSRFDSPNVKKNMSKWLRNQIGVANSFGQILPLLRNFFRDAEAIVGIRQYFNCVLFGNILVTCADSKGKGCADRVPRYIWKQIWGFRF